MQNKRKRNRRTVTALMDSGSRAGVEVSETQGNKDVKRPRLPDTDGEDTALMNPGVVEASETQGNKDVKRPRLPDPERECCIVFLGRGKGNDTSHHLEILRSVVNSANPSQYLIESYSSEDVSDSFVAMLTKEEAKKLEGMEKPALVFYEREGTFDMCLRIGC